MSARIDEAERKEAIAAVVKGLALRTHDRAIEAAASAASDECDRIAATNAPIAEQLASIPAAIRKLKGVLA